MDEKVEKRRSSILKFKKPTTDNTQEVETVVKRRVSFSQKKFVKEFDASLNTLQNSTYEEIAKECDSGQSLEKMEIEENQFIYQHSSTHVSGVQLPSSILLSQIEKDKENIIPVIIATQNTMHHNKNVKRGPFTPSDLDNSLSRNNANVAVCPEMTILNCNTMDLTAFIPSNIQNLKNNRTMLMLDNMDITNLPLNKEETTTGELNGETMDLTHVVCPVNRKSIINTTTRSEAMDFTITVPSNKQVNRHSILNSEIMDITCTGDELLVNNTFGQMQFSNTLFGGKIIKDTMDLTNFICKNNLQINSNNIKENCDASILQELSCIDMDLTGVNDNYTEQVLPPNSSLINNLAPEIKNTEHSIVATNKQETHSLNTSKKQLSINDTNITQTSLNALRGDECDKSIGLNYTREKSLPVYDVGGGILEQIQNGSIRDKILTTPFLQINAFTSNLNKWDCDSRKNSLINYTTANCSADDTQYLINFSVGGNKNPKSDFSRLIAGDFNPSFLSSKFLPLSEFESDAFTNEVLESLHMNHTGSKNQIVTEEPLRKSNKENDCITLQKDVTQHNAKENNKNEIYEAKTISTNQKNLEHNHIESQGNFKRSYIDTSNEVKNKIPKLDIAGTDKTFTIVSNTFSVMSEIISTNTRNISDESVVSFCNNSSEDFLEIHVEKVQNEHKNIKDETSEVDELKVLSEDLYKQLEIEINKNQTVLQKEIQDIEQRYVSFEKQQSYFDEICQKISTLLNKNYEIPIEKLKLNEADSSLEGQSSTSEISSVSESHNEFSDIHKELQMMCEKVVTIQDRVEQLQKTCQNCWSLVSSTPEEYTFETLYHTIIFTVVIDRLTGIVNNFHVQPKPDGDCTPKKLFIKNEFIKRMNSKVVSGAVGEKYDIVTLLDYVQMEVVHMTDMKKYFSDLSRIGFEMDCDFRVTLKIPSLILRSVWIITVSMSDIDNIDQDCVTIKAQVGVVDEEKMKSLLVPCPKGFAFLKHLVVTLLNYQKMLESRKKK